MAGGGLAMMEGTGSRVRFSAWRWGHGLAGAEARSHGARPTGMCVWTGCTMGIRGYMRGSIVIACTLGGLLIPHLDIPARVPQPTPCTPSSGGGSGGDGSVSCAQRDERSNGSDGRRDWQRRWRRFQCRLVHVNVRRGTRRSRWATVTSRVSLDCGGGWASRRRRWSIGSGQVQQRGARVGATAAGLAMHEGSAGHWRG